MTHFETNIEQDRKSKRRILTEIESAKMERLLFLYCAPGRKLHSLQSGACLGSPKDQAESLKSFLSYMRVSFK